LSTAATGDLGRAKLFEAALAAPAGNCASLAV
jgi:hypothetical protein